MARLGDDYGAVMGRFGASMGDLGLRLGTEFEGLGQRIASAVNFSTTSASRAKSASRTTQNNSTTAATSTVPRHFHADRKKPRHAINENGLPTFAYGNNNVTLSAEHDARARRHQERDDANVVRYQARDEAKTSRRHRLHRHPHRRDIINDDDDTSRDDQVLDALSTKLEKKLTKVVYKFDKKAAAKNKHMDSSKLTEAKSQHAAAMATHLQSFHDHVRPPKPPSSPRLEPPSSQPSSLSTMYHAAKHGDVGTLRQVLLSASSVHYLKAGCSDVMTSRRSTGNRVMLFLAVMVDVHNPMPILPMDASVDLPAWYFSAGNVRLAAFNEAGFVAWTHFLYVEAVDAALDSVSLRTTTPATKSMELYELEMADSANVTPASAPDEQEVPRLSPMAAASAPLLPHSTSDVAEGEECVVCLDRPKQTVCVPCGHVAVCVPCANALQRTTHKCPVCRRDVREVVKWFLT
ncbi:hypothetical protein DYB37_007542 [Aphanomyces astaci]|uniref:RING-type domain-containing protein n=1 Tax=Aphanomyces astaci TaxID=112090 RepID=A0A3R7FFE5_APHAT|nr:hypothetical protein DYB35_007123 [Aphanomyces astaci]RHZ33266.1 hypothetical protein DYB37_007542 [Aphanomyces astaci]